jgi:ribosomal protein L29
MKKEAFHSIAAMSSTDIRSAVLRERKKILVLRFSRQSQDGFKPDQIRKARKAIARFKTALGQQQLRQGGQN